MNRISERIWRYWSAYILKSTDWSWFTPKVAATLVLFLYFVSWLFILLVGKEHFLAMRATTPGPHPFVDSHGRPYISVLLMTLLLNASLLSWLVWGSSGRKLKIPYRSALLAMALAGLFGLATELWLRF
jgi:hypothetical protein